MQYAMVIDLDRCVGCHACAIACKAEWSVPTQFGRNWVHRLGPAKTPHGLSGTFYPGLCNHCDEPACVPGCQGDEAEKTFTDPKTGKTKTMTVLATYKDPFTGAVLIDKDRCVGCGFCVEACPYQARYIDEDLDEPRADKCTFCVERLAEGLEPACVQTCLSRARIFGDRDDPKSEVAQYIKKGAKRLDNKVVNIGPNVYYAGNKRDMHLLKETCTPAEMPEASLIEKRVLLARMGKSISKGVGLTGLMGMAACTALASEDKEED
jgi:tetrathionate reductase subunit B